MEIGWISNNFYPDYLGGAEMTDYELIESGENEHQVVRLNRFEEGFDLYIVSNVHRREPDWRIYNEAFVYFCHDSLPVESFQQHLINHSEFTIFLSPLHLDWAEETFDLNSEIHLQPGVINPDRFEADEKEENLAVYIGLLAEHKGTQGVIEYAKNHSNLDFELYGGKEMNIDFPENVEFKGIITGEDKIKKLAEAHYFIHLPRWIEAFGRSVAEAYFSDCELILNDNVGFKSYSWNYDDKCRVAERIEESKANFWEEIERLNV